MTRVKICGISEEEHALTAAGAGADFLGFVFAPSRRQVTPEKAVRIISTVRQLNCSPLIVGVFVNEGVTEVNRIATYCNLDWVQLSGDEKQEYCLKIERPLIKVIRVSSDKTPELITGEINDNYNRLERNKLIFLLDTHSSLAYGGTGTSFNWNLLKKIPPQHPMFIAGGLTPGNVSGLVTNIKPWGVDVSSGVETDGKKDSFKIKAFIAAVKKFPAER